MTEEIIDSLIMDCNNAFRRLLSGNYVAWCDSMTTIVNNLTALKTRTKIEADAKDRKIEELKEQLKRANETKDGEDDGTKRNMAES